MSFLKNSLSKITTFYCRRQSGISRFLLLFIFLISLINSALGGEVEVRGQVKGLISNDRKTVPVVLSEVAVSVALEGSVISEFTNLAGVYIVELKRDKRYLMSVSREGYHTKSVWINTHNLPEVKNKAKIELTDLDFLLLKKEIFPNDISSREDMGQLVYNPNKRNFDLNENRDWRREREGNDNSLKIIKKTITYIEGVSSESSPAELAQKKNDEKGELKVVENSDSKSSKEIAVENKKIEEKISFESGEYQSLEEIKNRKLMLDSAKMDLEFLRENARTKEDSLIVAKLEAQILAAELDLELAEKTILDQLKQIGMQQRLITITVIAALLLLLIVFVIFWFYRDKIKTNKLLAHKNQLIMDGITYANTIQSSFLKSEEEMQKILPEFVLLFRPRDIVSGDIYWVSKVDSKTVIAVIDCTGHGVPGAFISMIANTLLNEIVNNRKILDPGKILIELHKGVMDALQQDAGGQQSQDGMDMSLIVVDEVLHKIEFGGARNHIYKIKGGELEVIRADINSIGGRSFRSADGFKKVFTTKAVEFDEETVLFLFSDGFMDQFGGPENIKFNLLKFKMLLVKCAELDPEVQKRLLQETFDDWKGNNEQLDDVLVLGLKLKK